MDDLRHRIRFLPDATDIAVVSFDPTDLIHHADKERHISGQHVGLIENESHTGCSIVVLKREGDSENFFEPDSLCVAMIGKLGPMKAQVRWRKQVTDEIFRVGIELLD